MFIFIHFSSEDHDLLEFSYAMKVPLQVLKGQLAKHRKYKYHVESPLTHRGVISSLEFIVGINARNKVIDRCLKLHVPLNLIENQCKFHIVNAVTTVTRCWSVKGMCYVLYN